MTEMSPLRRRMIEDMTVRNMSPATQRSYVHAVAKFSRFFGRSPEKLDLEHVRTFQVHLVVGGMSWPALNQTVCALRFLYGVTLGRPDLPERIAHAREPQRLHVVLSADEVVRFLEALPGLNQHHLPHASAEAVDGEQRERGGGGQPVRGQRRVRFTAPCAAQIGQHDRENVVEEGQLAHARHLGASAFWRGVQFAGEACLAEHQSSKIATARVQPAGAQFHREAEDHEPGRRQRLQIGPVTAKLCVLAKG
jgi:hypothetical protein